MRNYFGLIYQDKDLNYKVSCPNFPEFEASWSDLQEAKNEAEKALEVFLREMIAFGESLPEPITPEALIADPNYNESVALFAVSLPLDDINKANENESIIINRFLIRRSDKQNYLFKHLMDSIGGES